MALLKQAVANGCKNAGHMRQDKELDPLRQRDDFKKLLAHPEATKQRGTGLRSCALCVPHRIGVLFHSSIHRDSCRDPTNCACFVAPKPTFVSESKCSFSPANFKRYVTTNGVS